ncbi:hypothetical protein Dimus_029161, partial [Dionaea muscipula]
MMRTTVEDSDFRVQVACRRSSRLSPSLPTISPDLVALEVESTPIAVVGETSEDADGAGVLPKMMVLESSEAGDGLRGEKEGKLVSSFLPELSPISEEEQTGVSSSSSSSGLSSPLPEAAGRLCQSDIGADGQASVSPFVPSSLVVGARDGERSPGLGSAMDTDEGALIAVARDEFGGSAECDRLPVVDDGALLADDRVESCGMEDGRLAMNLSENMGLTSGVGSAALVIDGPVRLSSSFDHVQDDSAIPGIRGTAVVAERVGQQLSPSLVSCCSLSLDGRDAIVNGGGRTVPQRCSQEVGRDSSSPDPFPGIIRGSPSPRAPRLRRGPPSPGLRPRRHRCPSPMPESSPDPEDFSSSEDGVSSEFAVTSEEDTDASDLEGGLLVLSPLHHLSPIPEEFGKGEASSSPSSGSTAISPATVMILGQDAIDDSGLQLVSSLTSSCLGGVDLGCTAGVGGDSIVINGDTAGSFGEDGDRVGDVLVTDRGAFHTAVEGDALIFGGGDLDFGVAQVASEAVTGDDLVATVNSSEVLCIPYAQLSSSVGEGLATSSVVVDTHKPANLHSDEARPEAKTVHFGDARPVAVVSMCSPILPLFCGSVGLGDGGSVSEEVRVTSVVGEALRSQPTDGLRQPPSSSAVPKSGVEGGAGMEGISGCRSFAH